MEADPFSSGTLATVLSWLDAVPIFLAVVGGAFASVFSPSRVTVKILYAWMLLCALALTPARYMIFQMMLGASYPWQSLRAFFSTFFLAIYVPIVFGFLCLVAFGIPILAAILIAGSMDEPRLSRLFVAAVVFPVACVATSWVYYDFALPLGARTLHWLHPADVMRAGNGPAYVTFKYLALPYTPMMFPIPAEQLSGSDFDLMRLHVASVYLSPTNRAWVLKTAYPKLFEQLYQPRSGSRHNFTFASPDGVPRLSGSVRRRASQCERSGAWGVVRVEFGRAVAFRSEIRRAGWFN